MSDVLAYGPILAVIAIWWATHSICEAISRADQKRREDHNELISELGDVRQLLVDIEACTSNMARVIDPPPTVDEMVAEYERRKP